MRTKCGPEKRREDIPPNPQGGACAQQLKEGNTQDQFERFWRTYPKKAAKQKAVRAFNKLHPDPELFKRILDSVETNARSQAWRKDDGQFIPHAATFINGRRWEDEPHVNGSGDGKAALRERMRKAQGDPI
jgi:hypothetical protein